MTNVYKTVFILLTIICRRYAIGETKCSHYYIPMTEDKFGTQYFMEPANISLTDLDVIFDIGVPRNCILLFDCVHIENNLCERPLVIKQNNGKHEFIGSNATAVTKKPENQLTTTIQTTPIDEQFAITPPTLQEEDEITTNVFSTTTEEIQLNTTILTTTTENEQLTTTSIPITTEQQPGNITNEAEDNYLIQFNNHHCKLNMSVFIEKNGCKINSEDGENGTLIYDCETVSLDDCTEDLESKDHINIGKLNETDCTNHTVIMKKTSSDTNFMLELNSKIGRETLNRTDKNACILVIVCNNDTHSKCKLIKSNFIWNSSDHVSFSSIPINNNNESELLNCLRPNCKGELLDLTSTTGNINTNQDTATSTISILLEHQNAVNRTDLQNNTNCNETMNCEKIKTPELVTEYSNEGNIYNATEPNGISTNRSSIIDNGITTTVKYNDNNITVQPTTVTEDISTASTINDLDFTTVVNIQTTLSDADKERLGMNKNGLIQNEMEDDNILPIVIISFGSVAFVTGVYLLVKKCINSRYSNQYTIPETVEMNQGFTSY